EVGHPDVREQQIHRILVHEGNRPTPALRHHDLVAVAAQHDAEHFAHRRLVVHHEHARRPHLGRGLQIAGRRGWGAHTARATSPASAGSMIRGCAYGSRTRTIVPWPTVDSTLIAPR